jgi:hypothetical protein
MCGRHLIGKSFFDVSAALAGAVMCPAYLCGVHAVGHNAFRGSGPNRKPALEGAMNQTDSPGL